MSKVAAFFDVDGTLVRGDIVRWYVHFATRELGRLRRGIWILGYLPQILRWLVLDQVDRRRLNIEFYRGYAGVHEQDLGRWAERDYQTLLASRIFRGGRERIAAHRARGERVVLVTGSLEILMRPLARALGADELLAVRMESEDGVLSGRIQGEPLAGDEKARAVRAWAARADVALDRSYAYGDSISDLPVLEAVGTAIAVNPDRKLLKRARARGWEIAEWSPG